MKINLHRKIKRGGPVLIMEQQLLFPELDPYKTKIKDIDYVDVSKIKCGELKKHHTVYYQKGCTYCLKVVVLISITLKWEMLFLMFKTLKH